MSDARLRELERRWREEGSPVDGGAFLRERLRRGDLTLARLELAAYCGDEAALRALDGAIEPYTARAPGYFLHLMPGQGGVPHVALAAAEVALPVWERAAPDQTWMRVGLEGARRRLEASSSARPVRPYRPPRRYRRGRRYRPALSVTERAIRWLEARDPVCRRALAGSACEAAVSAAIYARQSVACVVRGDHRGALDKASNALDEATLARADRPDELREVRRRIRLYDPTPDSRAAQAAWTEATGPMLELVTARLRAWALAVT